MVLFNLKVLAKFGLCSNCSQKLDGCSLTRARKIFATACQMLVLAKINTLLACSQVLAKTILYPSAFKSRLLPLSMFTLSEDPRK